MRLFRSFQRVTFLLILLVGGTITYTAYVAISNIVAQQSRIQQQAVSPVFSLVNEELLKPLHIAQTIAEAELFKEVMGSEVIDEKALSEQLMFLEEQFELIFFAASEKARKQYFSDKPPLALVEGKVFWYFEALAQEKDLFADLGQVGDVHLYFDFKIYDADNTFLGIVGVGKSLEAFISTFDQYKRRFGYDFLFVNEKNEIILTSLPDLVVTDAHIPKMHSLDWFGALQSQDDLNSKLINSHGEDYLLSEIRIEELNWKLLLMIPLEARQAQITKAFVTNTVMAVTIVVALFALSFWIMLLYRKRIESSIDLDPLTQLPNRSYVHRRFRQIQRTQPSLSIVMVDIDRFKSINDTYGHNAGDLVIKMVSRILTEEMGKQDLTGRWGGEEYIMLVPTKDEQRAIDIAERARQRIEQESVQYESSTLHVTASFGVTHGPSQQPLSELLATADSALYKAKKDGRNKVAFSNFVNRI